MIRVSRRLRTLKVSSSSWRTIVFSEGSVDATKSASRAGESMFITSDLQIVGKLRRTHHHFAEQFLYVALERRQFGIGLIFQIRLLFNSRAQERLQPDHFRNASRPRPSRNATTFPFGMRTIL